MALTSRPERCLSGRAGRYRSPQLYFILPEDGTVCRLWTQSAPRAAPLATLVIASNAFFRSGTPFRALKCRIGGTFRSSQERAEQNVANIEQRTELMESVAEDVYVSQNDVNDKFFMVATELAAFISVHKELLEILNCNWKNIQEYFEIFEHNIHVLRDFDQLLHSTQEMNFSYDFISSLLAVTSAYNKTYRSAPYNCDFNMMN